MKITSGGKVKVEGYNVGPKYRRMANSYNEEWEDEPECEGWLSRSEYGARCDACECELMPRINELKKHGRSQKHLRNMTTLWDKQGMSAIQLKEETPKIKVWQQSKIKIARNSRVNPLEALFAGGCAEGENDRIPHLPIA